MSKTIEQYESEIIKIIKDNPEVVNITEIFIKYTGCTRANFYLIKLGELDSIKQAIEHNKTLAKSELSQLWRKEKASPVCQIAAYKLMGTVEERKKLSQTFIEQSGTIEHKYAELTDEELDRQIEQRKLIAIDGECID